MFLRTVEFFIDHIPAAAMTPHMSLLTKFYVLSNVISPLPLGERVRVRGEKGISDGFQNTF
jgi:hypothetical protein